LLLAACVVVLISGSTGVMADGEVNLLYGKKEVDMGWPTFATEAPEELRRAWNGMVNDLEDHSHWGIMFTWGHDWPVALAIDYLDSKGDGSVPGYYYSVKSELETQEIDVGVRKFWGNQIQGYIGGGAAWIKGELDVTTTGNLPKGPPVRGVVIPDLSESASDSGLGFFVDGGIVWRAGSWFNLGLDVRYSDASVDLFAPNPDAGAPDEAIVPGSVDVGGFSYGLFVGARF
jgi:hypothetical protein